MTGFQRLCLATTVVVFGLIVIGGVVRATDSGLGCPDWPRCHGSFIPKWEEHTLIEYSHRFTATVAGFLGLSVLIVALRNYRHVPAILYVTCLGFVLGVTQAALGGAVVKNELPAGIVAVHLALGLTILTLLTLLTTTTFAIAKPPAEIRLPSGFGRLALVASATTLLLMLVGSYVSGSGYGLACSGWPLCNGDVVPSAGGTSVQMIFLHRVIALVLGVVLLALAWVGWRLRREAPFAAATAGVALALYVAQALVGAANVWTELADGVAAAHLALAAALWTLLTVLNIRVHRLYEVLPLTSGAPRNKLAGVTR
ncbi:MAG TPA: COX15/CtaA family protein [Dehalococcoidia bacterium]|nr:COX15/CtaA family protein [Dehalococcoidia bacterium]